MLNFWCDFKLKTVKQKIIAMAIKKPVESGFDVGFVCVKLWSHTAKINIVNKRGENYIPKAHLKRWTLICEQRFLLAEHESQLINNLRWV